MSLWHHQHHLTDRDLLILVLEQGATLMATQVDVLAQVAALSQQVSEVSAAVAAGFAAVSTPEDGQPVLDALTAVAAQVAAIPTHA